jgi:hypothetical protein
MDPQTAGARRKAERLAQTLERHYAMARRPVPRGLSDWYRRWTAGSTAARSARVDGGEAASRTDRGTVDPSPPSAAVGDGIGGPTFSAVGPEAVAPSAACVDQRRPTAASTKTTGPAVASGTGARGGASPQSET